MAELHIIETIVGPGLTDIEVGLKTSADRYIFDAQVDPAGEENIVVIEGPRGHSDPVRMTERLIAPGLVTNTCTALAKYALGRWWTTVGPGAVTTEGDRD